MASVTWVSRNIWQPQGGYLPVSLFEKKHIIDHAELGDENISPSIVGLAVDYVSRYMVCRNAKEAFDISLRGARIIKKEKEALTLLDNIRGLDDVSIVNACKLCGFDVVYRSGSFDYVPIESIQPDTQTIRNIQTMVRRCLHFFSEYGPIIKYEITFEGGYTDDVSAGDGDFITEDTLWDLKTTKRTPDQKHTLQLLIYYLMGIHSKYPYLQRINKLGIFNPRSNTIYLCEICNIETKVLKEAEDYVICYSGHKLNPMVEIARKDEDGKEYFAVSQAANILGISQAELYTLIKEKQVEATKEKGKWYINPDSVYNYKRKSTLVPVKKVSRSNNGMVVCSLFIFIVYIVYIVLSYLKIL